MIVLDASVVIAFMEADDAHHREAVELVVDLVADSHELVLHPLTAAEVLTGFVRSGRESEAWQDLAELGFTVRGVGDDPAAALLLARTRHRSGLKMPDAAVLATALHLGGTVLTFDIALRRAASAHGVLRSAAG